MFNCNRALIFNLNCKHISARHTFPSQSTHTYTHSHTPFHTHRHTHKKDDASIEIYAD